MGCGEKERRRRVARNGLWSGCGLLLAAGVSAEPLPLLSPTGDVAEVAEPVHVTRTYRQGERVEVRTAYIRQPEANGDSRGFVGLKLKSKLGERLPVVRAELGYGSFDPQASLALDETNHRSFWVGAQSSWQDLQYGFNYQSMGRDFVALTPTRAVIAPGKERAEVWGQRRIGPVGLRTFAWHSRDHFQEGATGPRFADTAVGTSLDYSFASVPDLNTALTYSRQITRPLHDLEGATTDGELIHNLHGFVSLRKEHWTTTLSSSYTYKPDSETADGRRWDVWSQSVATIYTPQTGFSIAPTLFYQSAPEYGNPHRTRSGSASVALQYQPTRQPFHLSATGSLGVDTNAAWRDQRSSFNTHAAIHMPLGTGSHGPQTGALTLQIGYTETTSAAASHDDVLVNLEVSLHRFN